MRYGLQNAQPSKEGYIVEYVNENNGKFFYDHEMTEIEAFAVSVREETRVELAKMKDKMLADKFGLLYCS